MKVRMRAVWGFATAVCLVLLCATHAGAQTVTTGTITGTVTDTQGGVLPGATVTAVHTDTGTNYEAVTGADGRYTILNVRVGGYTVSANMSGFKDQKQDKVTVQLGAEQTADFKLALASVSETVDVVANTPLIDLGRAGTADNIPNAVKESLPTISRSLTDIVRISPMFNTFGGGSGADSGSVVSVAGSSYRYNSMQIDGAINNDLFGLASSAGVPGGTAETQPVSLDAIQEIQLVVSPYDIRQGGFAGGGINAVTKSGTQRLPRHRLLLRPQPGLGGQGRQQHQDLDVQRQAGRGQPWRTDHEEQGVLLRDPRRSAQGAADRLLGGLDRPAVPRAGALRALHRRPQVPLRLRPGRGRRRGR